MTASDAGADVTQIHKPRHSDIDAWGVTHTGKCRKDNQDHYFVGSLSRGIVVDSTSLAQGIEPVLEPERLASFAMVADGVGVMRGGEEAARLAVQALLKEVATKFHETYEAEATDQEAFVRLLHDAALTCHENLLQRAERDSERMRFATTLTLFLGLWPHGYLLQVGDSRAYMFRDDELTQITRDQTMAQDLIDQGVLTQTGAHGTKWEHVLSSAIGGQQAAPVVTRIERKWGSVMLLCSDGLTKHVSDEQIKQRMAAMEGSRQLCEVLLQDALDGGGTDNITIVVGRTVRRVSGGGER